MQLLRQRVTDKAAQVPTSIYCFFGGFISVLDEPHLPFAAPLAALNDATLSHAAELRSECAPQIFLV
ncbi:MAG: hypothetical protein CMB79_17035 [Filomicrobium sp.]|nr:hypothetical protein [Filomicrobium sp.]